MAKLKKRPQHHKSSPQDFITLADETADSVDRSIAMDLLVSDRFYEIEPQIAAALSHPEGHLRGDAIYNLLARWQKRDYYDDAVTLLRSDPDAAARRQAAAALAAFAGWTGEEQDRDGVLRELVRALYAEQDDIRQGGLYESIRGLLRRNDGYEAPYPFDRERDVDKALIAPYLTMEGEATG